MAAVDSILVDAKLSVQSKYNNIDSTPIYIVRDHVQYYYKYVDNRGNVIENLTAVIFTLPVDGSLGLSLTIVLPLADFHTLMTA